MKEVYLFKKAMKNNPLETLKERSVGIAGAGGLGSNCAAALARVGIGKLVIADFDTIDRSNLNRQYYFTDQIGQKKVTALKKNIERINPEVEVVIHDLVLDTENIPDIYADCDVIVEAFDRAEMKEMIIETVQSRLPGIPIVAGVGLAGWGDNNLIRTEQYENLYVCGDGKNETSDLLPPLAPRVGVVASMQANQVMEILLGKIL